MNEDETIVLRFLEAAPETFFARREIARKAVKRTVFEENPNWVDAPLTGLVSQRLIEQNDSGHYRFKKPSWQV
jgi:hypothetical protein